MVMVFGVQGPKVLLVFVVHAHKMLFFFKWPPREVWNVLFV